MVLFPNAKINLGLNVTDRRNDGYHNILSVFYPVGLCDVLEFVKNKNSDTDSITYSGLPIPGNPAENLITKALILIREIEFIPPLEIHLHKIIPMGAGLGGGSADGTFFLKALNQQFQVGLTDEKLEELALKLGSDCPFFVQNNPLSVSGRGEHFEDIDVNLTGKYIVLVFSDLHISTGAAYREMDLKEPTIPPAEVVSTLNIDEWSKFLTNDFEDYAFAEHPELKKIKSHLYELGAIYASMTGSGSTIYGIFDAVPENEKLSEIGANLWVGRL